MGATVLLISEARPTPVTQTAQPASHQAPLASPTQRSPQGVCPPLHLRDEDGNIIDPIGDSNAGRPYSPRQTCGRCHDYQKITKGYHFTQGRGEKPTADQAKRCGWARTPGNYGGTWCSPAPLYRYLSAKNNSSSNEMDMTSFSFIKSGCGGCHPGGGPVEFDREGKRYDRWMSDPESGFSPGADNDFDGDYYRARWSETGVLEADCLLCHLPEYDFSQRKKQLSALNFRWAPAAAAGFASVSGSVKDGDPPKVVYDKQKFNPDGTISPHIVHEPRNQTCLACHAKPGWKKRGANFRNRTDVHLRAGLKCVDCHPAGSSATDPRIGGHEEHHIGKGDDPGGHVRDDLDNTCRSCADCHSSGYLGAPIAKHRWLPPLHLEKIACQTCHIPQRAVKSAQVVASDVFNPGAKIPTAGKHLWTFYGPDMEYWNYYGDLEMMGYDDKPTDPFRPILVRYKGLIYPASRIHNTWPAIEEEGKPGLMQPQMSSVYGMWSAHHADPTEYPALAEIVDDNGDGVPEINRTVEIAAIIHSVDAMLRDIEYPMEGKRVVWVMNDRVYRSGTDYRPLDKHPWEASPYANVHTYSHDVYPARSALGARGCADCHHPDADFFFASVVKYPFGENAKPVMEPQYCLLGLTGTEAIVGAWREAYLKPVIYGMMIVLVLAGAALFGGAKLRWVLQPRPVPPALRLAPWIAACCLGGSVLYLIGQRELVDYLLPTRFWLDSNHVLVVVLVAGAGLAALTWEIKATMSGTPGDLPWRLALSIGLALSLGLVCVAGALMLFRIPGINTVTRVSYTLLDVAVAFVIAGAIFVVLHRGFSVNKEERIMCEAKQGCPKPEALEAKPHGCSPEQIKKCHGDVQEHPCVETDKDQ